MWNAECGMDRTIFERRDQFRDRTFLLNSAFRIPHSALD
jgi:hypothetical protein